MRYFTKDYFLKSQVYPQTQASLNESEETNKNFREVQAKENLPKHLRQNFLFHDGIILKVETETDCIIEIDSPFSQYHKIRFCNAVVKQELPPVGATWLYSEVYRHKSGNGWEVHILSIKMMKPTHNKVLSSDLFETKIICSDILFE